MAREGIYGRRVGGIEKRKDLEAQRRVVYNHGWIRGEIR